MTGMHPHAFSDAVRANSQFWGERILRLFHRSQQPVRGAFLLALITLLAAMLGLSLRPASAEPRTPGTAPSKTTSVRPRVDATAASLSPVYTEAGKLRLAVDGLGSNDPAGGIIQIEKPAGATVRRAFLAAASTGFTGHSPVVGDVVLDGVPVSWDPSMTIPNSIASVNVWAEVTSLVKAKLDAAPAGLVDFAVTEPIQTYQIDGEILAVVFDDPSVSGQHTISLIYGAQNVAGDSFQILLAEPIDKSDPELVLNLALGISYGYQPAGQYSQVDVNGQRLSTSAGGQDDGAGENGALLTVGGVGDSTANPANPLATDLDCVDPPAPRCDDELYDLLPFVQNGDKVIDVDTQNPSSDDNIFFGALQLPVAVVGEGILLTPVSATNEVGTTHTLTGTVQDDDGNPISGKLVTFEVVAGPNAGTTLQAATDSSGHAVVSYTSATTGIDHIVASFVDSQGNTKTSNEATKEWVAPSDGGCTITGTTGDDVLTGTPGNDVICGLAGNDMLLGMEGDDRLIGGKGDDELSGGDGNDVLKGDDGNDQLDGAAGADELHGNSGDDQVTGGDGDDRLFGHQGNDHLAGGAGDDRLYGSTGEDELFGADGDDRLEGGIGKDRLEGGGGADWLFGDDGDDTLAGGPEDDRLFGGHDSDQCDGGPETIIDRAKTCEVVTGVP
jgi:Ca2+-binding RTX toxin-like protein